MTTNIDSIVASRVFFCDHRDETSVYSFHPSKRKYLKSFVATEKKAILRRAADWRLQITPLKLDGYGKRDSQLDG